MRIVSRVVYGLCHPAHLKTFGQLNYAFYIDFGIEKSKKKYSEASKLKMAAQFKYLPKFDLLLKSTNCLFC
jgi:hypothetical protein